MSYPEYRFHPEGEKLVADDGTWTCLASEASAATRILMTMPVPEGPANLKVCRAASAIQPILVEQIWKFTPEEAAKLEDNLSLHDFCHLLATAASVTSLIVGEQP